MVSSPIDIAVSARKRKSLDDQHPVMDSAVAARPIKVGYCGLRLTAYYEKLTPVYSTSSSASVLGLVTSFCLKAFLNR